MRVLIASCTVDYSGRLSAHLDRAVRLIMHKADGSVLIHSDGGSYKPLNWMNAPCTVTTETPEEGEELDGVTQIWQVQADKTDDRLVIRIHEIISDVSEEFGVDPGLVKDGVETHLQELLAEQVPPVDLLVRDPQGLPVAIEVKRRGGMDGVDQLTRYLSLLGRDPLLDGIRGIFAAQEITKQARTLAEDRGIDCLILDYDAMRGFDDPDSRLF